MEREGDLITKDAASLKRIIADDRVDTDDKGKTLNREQYISQTTSNTDLVQSNENTDLRVRVYSNTAVVTGGLTEKGTRNGTAYLDTYRWTDVFAKSGGHWQAVVFQWESSVIQRDRVTKQKRSGTMFLGHQPISACSGLATLYS